MTDAKAPHKAVVLLVVEVHEVLPNGECSAKLVDSDELAKFSLKEKRVIQISGFDRTDCLKKLKGKIDEFAK